MKARRGYTLVELTVALTLAALVALVAGRLLLDALDAWQAEEDRAATRRECLAALDQLADDFAAQPLDARMPAPVATLDLDAPATPAGLFIVGARGEPHAIAWVRLPDGSLWRLEAPAADTRARLPGNAAALQIPSQASAGSLEAGGARRMARGVASLHTPAHAADAFDAAQVQLVALTRSAAAGVPGGTPVDAALAGRLPPRDLYQTARVLTAR